MKTITLHFRDILELIEFTAYLETDDFEVNVEAQTLICAPSDAQLELAVNGFLAVVVSGVLE